MRRFEHLLPEPLGINHWDLKGDSQFYMLFEVTDKQNRAGFTAFQVSIDSENGFKCDLFIKNDEYLFDKVAKELGQTIVDNSSFFEGFRLASSLKKVKTQSGYLFSSQDQKMVEILIYYADRKLQFSGDHYHTLEKMVALKPENTTGQPKFRCSVM